MKKDCLSDTEQISQIKEKLPNLLEQIEDISWQREWLCLPHAQHRPVAEASPTDSAEMPADFELKLLQF